VHTDQATVHLTDRTEYWRLHPSLHLSYNLTDTRQLQLNYSHRVHRPESDDLNPFPEYQDPFNLRAGNPRLRPAETHSVEAGYQYRKDDTTYLAAVFFRDTYHAFTTVTRYIDPVTLLTTQENLSSNRSGGLELAATTELWSKVSVNASANAFRSEIDAKNLGFAGKRSTIAWDAKLNLSWRATKVDTVQVDANYSARRLTAQGYRLPTALANVGWRHDFKDRKYAFTLTVSDVFDSLKERTVIDTPTLHDEIMRRRSSRIIYAGFIYNFGKPTKKGKKDDLQFDTSL
jgi:outer membrane receptor protein involved in Fe transport